jgi:hypothetical protein
MASIVQDREHVVRIEWRYNTHCLSSTHYSLLSCTESTQYSVLTRFKQPVLLTTQYSYVARGPVLTTHLKKQ